MTVVVLNVLAASAIFHQGYAYAAYVGHGMVISMLVAAVGPIVLLALSKLPVIYCADTFVAALFSDMAASILTKNPKAPWATLCASMALSTALMGVSEWLLGALQVGKVVQFVPTPVMTGYLASIGYILLDSCTKMVTGCGILNVTGLQASGKIDQLAVAFFIAVGLYQAAARPPSHAQRRANARLPKVADTAVASRAVATLAMTRDCRDRSDRARTLQHLLRTLAAAHAAPRTA
eukprot:1575905-Pleurochrysis_carterae.AAC.2